MLSFNIRDLEHTAATVDGTLGADDPVWLEGDPVPLRPVHVTGRLSKAGAGRFYLSGHLEGETVLECRRCLSDVTVPVADDVQLVFEEALDEDADDADVYTIEPRARELDLRPAIREQWLLNVPTFALCREECKGLCPRCGADLNVEPHECAQHADPRWDALRSSRGESK